MGTHRKGYYVVLLLLIALSATIFTGCATTGGKLRSMSAVSRYFDKDINTVWDAVIQAAEGMRVDTLDKEKGVLRTQWVKGWSTEKTTGLFTEGRWQERYRLIIKLTAEQNKTYISVNAQIEEKPPAGSAAYLWNRTPSDGTLEEAFLKKVENILGTQ